MVASESSAKLTIACDVVPTTRFDAVRNRLRAGVVIPAHPLALTADRRLDERRQRALSRYYLASGAGGLAVGVHTTQFAVHEPKVGLLRPVWELAAEELNRAERAGAAPAVRVAGICGPTKQAVAEAGLAVSLGYEFGLLRLAAFAGRPLAEAINHCRAVSEIITLFGFYLQPRVGGIDLPAEFWREFCSIDNVAAIKVAAFDRYKTLDVVRAVAESGRREIALYTGNDDNIVADLLTLFRFQRGAETVELGFVGGLLGQWAVWTSKAVTLLEACRGARAGSGYAVAELLTLGAALTDANAAVFDAANDFRGCLAGIHEVLRRQGLLAGTWCLEEREQLSAGQSEAIARVQRLYPELQDDEFVAERLGEWLGGA